MPYYPPNTGGGGGGGGGIGTGVVGETPSGAIDGNNNVFILSHLPISNTIKIFLNGLRQKENLDFIIYGATIMTATPPFPNDILLADYYYS
jgi:hypothetical protein